MNYGDLFWLIFGCVAVLGWVIVRVAEEKYSPLNRPFWGVRDDEDEPGHDH